jgi:hypothetical protein
MKSIKSILAFLFFAAFLVIFVGWNSASANSNSFQNQEYILQFQPSVNDTFDSWTYSNDMECPTREDPVKESGIEPQ